MTQLEFRKALRKGRGLCVYALEDAAALRRFKGTVLWACSKDLCVDAQSEGTRARFLADIVGCYPDKLPFVEMCERTIQRNWNCRDWVFQQSSELLGLLALDGNRDAYAALLRSFGGLVRHEQNQNRDSVTIQAKENAMSLLAEIIPLCRITADQVLIAKGIRRLFSVGSGFDAEFRQELLEIAKRCSASIVEESLENARWARDEYDDFEQGGAEGSSKKHNLTRLHLLRMKRMGCLDDVKNYAIACVAESNWRIQAKLLEAFADSALIEFLPRKFVEGLLDSRHQKLAAVGLTLMAKMRSAATLKLGRKLLQDNIAFDKAMEMVARNCKKQDERLLLSGVMWAERFGRCRRHSIHHAVICAMKDSGGVIYQRRVLELLADSVECSCCRERCVRLLDGIGCLKKSLLEECCFDAGASLREFARKRLKGSNVS